jgi:K+-sensing histidine kinase KdpD
LACCAALVVVRGSITNATAALVLVLVVVGFAAVGLRSAGFVAAVSSGVWFDFLLTEPYQRFTINDPDDIEAMVLLLAVGFAVTELALWGRREQARASRRAGYLDGVVRTAEIVASRREAPEALVDRICSQIGMVLAADECKFDPVPVRDPSYAVLDHDGAVTRNGHKVDVERDGLPTDEKTAVVVRRGGAVVGQFLLTTASRLARPSVEQRRVAVLLADQAAAAFPGRWD